MRGLLGSKSENITVLCLGRRWEVRGNRLWEQAGRGANTHSFSLSSKWEGAANIPGSLG